METLVKRESMFKVAVLGYRLFFIGLWFIVAATDGDDAYEHFIHLFAENLYQWYAGHGSSVSHVPFLCFQLLVK